MGNTTEARPLPILPPAYIKDNMTAQSIDRPRKPGRTKIKQVTAMKIAGMTERDIAAATNISKTSVHTIINREFSKDDLDQFKTTEADSLKAFRLQYISLIDQDDIKKMIERRGMVDYGIAYDKEMNARGLGDSNKQPMVIILRDRIIDRMPIDNSQIIDVDSAPLIESTT
jgi:hypothetical protein